MNAALHLDLVGDVHGQRSALDLLLRDLGYDPAAGWEHPEGRRLVFLGDLIDRGPDGLGVAELVRDLCGRGLAGCVMGNHEYNLVRCVRENKPAKTSNGDTLADVKQRPARWEPIVDFFATLPLTAEFGGLRIAHADWHEESVSGVRGALGAGSIAHHGNVAGWFARAITLASPFHGRGLHPGLPDTSNGASEDLPHEVIMKGREVASEPFADSEGDTRHAVRVCWWNEDALPAGTTTVFGHYWNLPPMGEPHHFTPPFPSGHPTLRRWYETRAHAVQARGRAAVPAQTRTVCIDYNGVTTAGQGACVGAFRWPEREVAWVRLP